MPYPAKVTPEIIITTAWEMVEAQGGIEQLSLSALAKTLGIKAPSLYRHVANKAALLKAINELTNQRLFTAIDGAFKAGQKPPDQLRAVAHAQRRFAHQHPVSYMLAFTTSDSESRPDADEQEQAVLPFQGLMAEVVGEENSLPALRGFLALVHGFVMLELNDQLRRGGDLNMAFEQSVDAYLRGWSDT